MHLLQMQSTSQFRELHFDLMFVKFTQIISLINFLARSEHYIYTEDIRGTKTTK